MEIEKMKKIFKIIVVTNYGQRGWTVAIVFQAEVSGENGNAGKIIAHLEGVVLISKVRNDPSVFAAAEPAVLRLLGAVAEE